MTSSPSEVGRITLERVTFRYLEQSKRPVLDEVSASFDRSRITVLTGPSGCGKSTLLYLAAGIYPQNAGFLQGGTVRVEGQEPAALGPGERCALVGMLFQLFRPLPEYKDKIGEGIAREIDDTAIWAVDLEEVRGKGARRLPR